jgi:hypothetical protein
VTEDIDLDANAASFSYAGHHLQPPSDSASLRMLSEPPVSSIELAKINQLKQKRFDTWQTYYQQVEALVHALPGAFEETILRQFVTGIYQQVTRKQCGDWLETQGWTWDNMTSFSALCTQIQRQPTGATTTTQPSPQGFRQKLVKLQKANLTIEETAGTERTQPTCATQEPPVERTTIRRSQRLAETEAGSRRPLLTGAGAFITLPVLLPDSEPEAQDSAQHIRLNQMQAERQNISRLPATESEERPAGDALYSSKRPHVIHDRDFARALADDVQGMDVGGSSLVRTAGKAAQKPGTRPLLIPTKRKANDDSFAAGDVDLLACRSQARQLRARV